MPQIITDVMQKEMTRKEFMAALGFGVLSIFGFSTVLHMLTGKSFSPATRSQSTGYGSNGYGR